MAGVGDSYQGLHAEKGAQLDLYVKVIEVLEVPEDPATLGLLILGC